MAARTEIFFVYAQKDQKLGNQLESLPEETKLLTLGETDKFGIITP